jgi:hypothetical protein
VGTASAGTQEGRRKAQFPATRQLDLDAVNRTVDRSCDFLPPAQVFSGAEEGATGANLQRL